MSEVLNALMNRRSIRSYSDEPVAQEQLDKIIEAGLYAASGMGKQAPVILAVTDRKLRDELSKMNAAVMGREDMDPFYGAPYVLVVLADRSVPTYVYDGSLTMGNMMLAAHELGLGTCWIHRAKQVFETERGKEILKQAGLEGDYEGIGNLILGHIAEGTDPKPAPRKEGRVFFLR